ncbi:MAG: DUF4159 domain-containing protein [Clostridia bacterium]|nr:DUF4159 domain-containing protein [Clostridia bacterium]
MQNKQNIIIQILLLLTISIMGFSQDNSYRIALLKYSGGGDWYANPTALPNLIDFCNQNLGTRINPEPVTVEAGSNDIYNYPFIHMTGHGNVVFSDYEAENLRNYLLSGGFLHIDDNYGMDPYIRAELERIFPDIELVELPYTHPIYHQKYDFKTGLPKIHEHDNQPPQGFGIIHQGRLIVFYTFETDLGDGWEDEPVHNNSYGTRLKALQMGANIINYVFNN